MSALQTWLEKQGERPHSFARRLSRPTSTITRILKGERCAGPRLAKEIEIATGGEVTAAELLLERLKRSTPMQEAV